MNKLSSPVLFAAPHRVMFLAGTVQIFLVMVLWLVDLAMRRAGLTPPAMLPSSWLHALCSIFGFFPFYIFGFLMTALPRWIGASPLPKIAYLTTFLLMSAGWLLFYLASALSVPVAPAALFLTVAGWLWGAFALILVTERQKMAQRAHARAACLFLFIGALALAAFILALLRPDPLGVQRWIELGLWGFLLPIFVTISHRMLPFFSQSVLPDYEMWRPMYVLWAILACLIGHFLLPLFGLGALLFLVDGLACVLVILCLIQWRFWRSFKIPMLAMLHLGTVWLAIGLGLFVIRDLSNTLLGGLAPLHALTIGYMGSVLLAMATRVTLGHSGKAINSDTVAWPMFWLLQAVVVVRLVAESETSFVPSVMILLAASGWVVVFGTWAFKYIRMYFVPRVDGKPG